MQICDYVTYCDVTKSRKLHYVLFSGWNLTLTAFLNLKELHKQTMCSCFNKLSRKTDFKVKLNLILFYFVYVGGPCHLSSSKHWSEDLISVLGKKKIFLSLYFDLISIVNIKTFWVWISSPKLHSAPLKARRGIWGAVFSVGERSVCRCRPFSTFKICYMHMQEYWIYKT